MGHRRGCSPIEGRCFDIFDLLGSVAGPRYQLKLTRKTSKLHWPGCDQIVPQKGTVLTGITQRRLVATRARSIVNPRGELLAHTFDVAHCRQIQHLALGIKARRPQRSGGASGFSFTRAVAIYLDDHRVPAPYVDAGSFNLCRRVFRRTFAGRSRKVSLWCGRPRPDLDALDIGRCSG